MFSSRQPAREMTTRERAAESEMREGAERARLRRQQDYEYSLNYRKPFVIFAGLAVGAITYYTL